jgi:hypothetical protein
MKNRQFFPDDHPKSCVCRGLGRVCEDHPDVFWDTSGTSCCGGAGMPCEKDYDDIHPISRK